MSSKASQGGSASPMNRQRGGKSATGAKKDIELNLVAKVFAFLTVVAWLFVFTAGVTIDSKPVRDALQVHFGADQVRLEALGEAERIRALAQEMAANEEVATLVAKSLAKQSGSGTLPAVSAAVPGASTTGLAGIVGAESLLSRSAYKVQQLSWYEVPVYLFAAATCYIASNIAILAILGSLLGAFGNIARLGNQDEATRPRDNSNPYVSAMIRGFTVYMIIVSGMLAVVEAPFSSPSAEQYLRLAGFISLTAFLVSYDPRIYQGFLEKAKDGVIGSDDEDDEDEEDPSAGPSVDGPAPGVDRPA